MSGVTIAAAVAVGASAVGLGLALRTKKSDDVLERKPSRGEELESQYQFVLKEIRALDAEKHQHVPEEYTRERERLTREAVRLLKAAESAPKKKSKAGPSTAATAPTPTPTEVTAKGQSGWMGALAGAGTVMLATVVAMSVWNTASPRSDGSVTGGNERMVTAQQQADAIAEAVAFVREHPEEVDVSAQVARELLQRNRLDEASELVDAALAVSPQHVASRILRLVIDGTRGDAYSAMEALRKIAEEGPAGREALLYRGTMALRLEDRATALDSFERYAKEAPPSEHPEYLVHVLDILREKDASQQ